MRDLKHQLKLDYIFAYGQGVSEEQLAAFRFELRSQVHASLQLKGGRKNCLQMSRAQ